MNTNITNIAQAMGTFNSLPTSIISSEVITLLTDSLNIEKTADKQVWAGGNLTYTITVTNTDTSYDYENVTLTDVIDPLVATLVDDSVTLNGVSTSAYTFDDVTGMFSLNMGTIAASATGTVTFQIEKV